LFFLLNDAVLQQHDGPQAQGQNAQAEKYLPAQFQHVVVAHGQAVGGGDGGQQVEAAQEQTVEQQRPERRLYQPPTAGPPEAMLAPQQRA
jgi:hypothetical protein